MNILSPSMLSIDFGFMDRELKKVYEAGATTIHVDVMDGAFVPNITYGVPVMKYVRRAVPDAVLDVHMMVQEPLRYLQDFIDTGAGIFTIHTEAVSDLRGDVERIREAGIKAGVAINPETPVSELESILDIADMILVMSVHPGFGGQNFILGTLDKIRDVRSRLDRLGKNADIEVDGGINLNNVQEILDAGANVIVAGSSVFNGDSERNVRDFLEILG